MTRKLGTLALCALLAVLPGCGFLVVQGARYAYGIYKAPEKEVNAALEQVRSEVLKAGWGATGPLWAADAHWSTEGQLAPVVGRDAILQCLTADAGSTTLAYALAATRTDVRGDTADQRGTYQQTLRAPEGHAQVRSGDFEARWQRHAENQWRLVRWHDRPTPRTQVKACTTD